MPSFDSDPLAWLRKQYYRGAITPQQGAALGWILFTAFWNDNAVWNDGAAWRDV